MTDERITELWRESYTPTRGLKQQIHIFGHLIAAETARECVEIVETESWSMKLRVNAFKLADAIRRKFEVGNG